MPKGRKPYTPEQRLEALRKKQASMVESPAQKFFESCQEGGIYVESPIAAEHNHGHYVGVQKLNTSKTESGQDAAIVIFEVMKSVIDGRLLRKPRYSSNSAGTRCVTYPQMTIEWAQAEGVARGILGILGGKGGEIKSEVLSSDAVVTEEKQAAEKRETFDQYAGLDC